MITNKIKIIPINNVTVIQNIRNITKEYVINNNLKSLVLGVSGGIDSAIVAVLLQPVCNELKIPLIGRYIHIDSNKPDEKERAKNIGKNFCTEFISVDLTDYFYHLKKMDDIDITNDKARFEINYKIRQGNIKARMRMIYLYNIASFNQGMVLGTDNKTEEQLSFFTLHGDHFDYNPIQNLWKTEVYELADYLINLLSEEESKSLQACVDCDATDGLGISTTDLDQIMPDWQQRHKTTRGGYTEVDDALHLYLETGIILDRHQNIIDRHLRTSFKRNWPYNISREDLLTLDIK